MAENGEMLLGTAMLAAALSLGYLIGVFIGHCTETINGLYFLPVIASLAYLAIAGLACKEGKR